MKLDCNLELNEYLNNCDRRDIIALDSRDPLYLCKFFVLLKSAFDVNLINHISNIITQKLQRQCNAKLWFEDGEYCEILKAGTSGWQTGKLKLKVNLSLEFIPDEPQQTTSPLDDVRQEINQNNI